MPYCRLNREALEKSVFLGFKRHRGAIHAITQARFGGTVGKNMAKMPVAGRTANLDPTHAEAVVFDLGDRIIVRGCGKARPAAAAVEFAFGFKQFAATSGAEKFAIAIFRIERTGKGPFGTCFAQYVKLFRRKLLPPFFVVQYCFFHIR